MLRITIRIRTGVGNRVLGFWLGLESEFSGLDKGFGLGFH